MDVQKPKLVHGWGELLKEWGIIVLGVLTALAFEQAVAAMHEHRQADEARRNIRSEIADNLGLMESRERLEPCVSRRLDEVQELISRPAQGDAPIWIGHPPLFMMVDSQFRSAAQAGRTSLLPTSEQAIYAQIYANFDQYNEGESRELKALADLRTLEQGPNMTPEVTWQLHSALQQARTARWTLEITDATTHRFARKLGVKPANLVLFTAHSICLPLHTERAEALKLVLAGRKNRTAYDEP